MVQNCKSSAFGTSLVNFHSDEDDDGMVMVMTRGVPNTSGMKKAIKTKRVGGGEEEGSTKRRLWQNGPSSAASQWPHFPSSPIALSSCCQPPRETL